MIGMFYECSSLKKLDFPYLALSTQSDMSSMFYGCPHDFKMKIKEKFKNLEDNVFED